LSIQQSATTKAIGYRRQVTGYSRKKSQENITTDAEVRRLHGEKLEEAKRAADLGADVVLC
jgi:hypothetical protein